MKRYFSKEIILKSFDVGRTIYLSSHSKETTIEQSDDLKDFYDNTVQPKIAKIHKKSPNVLFRLCLNDFLQENYLGDYKTDTFHYRGNNLNPYCWAATFPPNIKKAKASPQLYILVESEIIRFGFDYGVEVVETADVVSIVKENLRLQRLIFKLIKSSPNLDLYSSVDDHTDYMLNKIEVNKISDISTHWTKKVHIMRAIQKANVPDDIEEIIRYTLTELLPIYQFICTGKETKEMSSLTKKLLKKAQVNKQLIITGAPGTGKTHSAKKLAAELSEIDESDPSRDFHVGFVQFHPSYDYTDFIDGLKPTITDSGEMIFSLKNGIFKEFCRKAGVIERIIYNAKSENDKGNLHEIINNKLEMFCHGFYKEFWEKWVEENKTYLEGLNIDLLEFEENYHGLIDTLPQFSFIIDEINRGEISKVFGELMYCLEPGYRGLNGVIKTQYSGLSNEESFYINQVDDKFFVPSNLYLIGTMNDIDRSVDIFDFAMRRRFAWHEIIVTKDFLIENLKEMLKGTEWSDHDNLQQLVNRANALNEKFLDSNGPMLGYSYQLGPAYFKKISLYGNGEEAYIALWENHIQPLIQEYMRGNNHYSKFIKECKDALTIPQKPGA